MKKQEFIKWLIAARYKPNVANTRAGNCETVCTYEGDLDILFAKDHCADLLSRLCYSTDDERNNRPTKHKIPINGNKRTGSATLKQAVNLYVKFLNNESIIVRNTFPSQLNHNNASLKNDWPTWEEPSENDEFKLAQIITKYIRFLSPDIIKAIVDDNEKIKETVCSILEANGIKSELYFWDKTSCCFPGVRRYAGSSEISAYRGRSEINSIEDAISLDDNDYPKQLWSFIFRGLQFSKFGPLGYSLAHLVDHKKDKNRMSEEFLFINGYKFDKPFYGLYTCASNSVYIPNNLMKPTDFNGAIRNLLFRKAESLYGDYCNLIPPYIEPKNIYDEKWNIDNFEWAEPVGTLDYIELFLDFRNERLIKLFNKK